MLVTAGSCGYLRPIVTQLLLETRRRYASCTLNARGTDLPFLRLCTSGLGHVLVPGVLEPNEQQTFPNPHVEGFV